jgi:hypothetical protein
MFKPFKPSDASLLKGQRFTLEHTSGRFERFERLERFERVALSSFPNRRSLFGECPGTFLGVFRAANQCGQIGFQPQTFLER